MIAPSVPPLPPGVIAAHSLALRGLTRAAAIREDEAARMLVLAASVRPLIREGVTPGGIHWTSTTGPKGGAS